MFIRKYFYGIHRDILEKNSVISRFIIIYMLKCKAYSASPVMITAYVVRSDEAAAYGKYIIIKNEVFLHLGSVRPYDTVSSFLLISAC